MGLINDCVAEQCPTRGTIMHVVSYLTEFRLKYCLVLDT